MVYWPVHIPLHFCLLFSWTHPSLRLIMIYVRLRSVFLLSWNLTMNGMCMSVSLHWPQSGGPHISAHASKAFGTTTSRLCSGESRNHHLTLAIEKSAWSWKEELSCIVNKEMYEQNNSINICVVENVLAQSIACTMQVVHWHKLLVWRCKCI